MEKLIKVFLSFDKKKTEKLMTKCQCAKLSKNIGHIE